MTRLLTVALGIAVLSTASAPGARAADTGMAVFVTAAQVPTITKLEKPAEQALQLAVKTAETARKTLEKSLKAQHGKKREDWPEAARDQIDEAEENEAIANADWAYRKVKQEGLQDTAEDIRKSIVGDGMAGRKEHITLVDSAAEAQLIFEVNGRRSGYSGATGGLMAVRDDQYWISVLVKPGPKLSAEAFAAVPKTYRLRRAGYQAFRLAVPRPDTPYWRFEPYGMMRWGAAANVASILIEDFIGKNVEAMTAAASR